MSDVSGRVNTFTIKFFMQNSLEANFI